MSDTLTNAYVEITVQLPDLEIRHAQGNICCVDKNNVINLAESLQKLKNVRIGPGMLKIIKGLIGDGGDNQEVVYMVEECCHGVILFFTKDMLVAGISEKAEDVMGYYRKMVKDNIRMYNRCAAFAPGSPFVEGIKPSGQ